jgi:hypothetical protein
MLAGDVGPLQLRVLLLLFHSCDNRAYSCGVCMSSVTSCVGGGWFLCFTCLHVPYSTVTLITTVVTVTV